MTKFSMKIEIKRLDKSLPLPQYHTSGSAGFDLYSRVDAIVPPGGTADLPSNLIIAVPEGFFLLIAARSSLSKKGLMLANGVGVSDSDYRGPEDEIRIRVLNFTKSTIAVKTGDRLAQGLVLPFKKADWEEIDEISDVSRGGFGSTG